MSSTLLDRELVPVTPRLFKDFACPVCASTSIASRGVVFPGAHVLGDYHCDACSLDFLRDLPVGFSVDHPVAIAKTNGTLFNPHGAEGWLHGPLLKAFNTHP